MFMFKYLILCVLLLCIFGAEPAQSSSSYMKKTACGKRVTITIDECGDVHSGGGRPGGCDYPPGPGCDLDCLAACLPPCNGMSSCSTACLNKCGC